MLTVTDLCVHYGPIRAVQDLTINIPEGAFVTLLGGNGAGKTTTLRALSGLLRPTRGQVLFNGEDITRQPAHRIVACGLGHVPEGRLIFANLTVEENLTLGAYLSRDRVADARTRDQVLALFPRLTERLRQPAGTLSGGEQQMLAIGRALMSRPRFLMLDEPSLGIAPQLITTLLEALAQLNRTTGLTVLLVEQNAHLALSLSSHAYVLESGRLVMAGPSATLRDDPRLRAAYLGG